MAIEIDTAKVEIISGHDRYLEVKHHGYNKLLKIKTQRLWD